MVTALLVAFAVVSLASAAAAALITYVADEVHHEHLDHPKEDE